MSCSILLGFFASAMPRVQVQDTKRMNEEDQGQHVWALFSRSLAPLLFFFPTTLGPVQPEPNKQLSSSSPHLSLFLGRFAARESSQQPSISLTSPLSHQPVWACYVRPSSPSPPYLSTPSFPCGLYDGDHPTKPSITIINDPSPARESKEVQEVHALVRNDVYKDESELPGSYRFWPGFVSLLEQNVEGEISCMHHPLEA